MSSKVEEIDIHDRVADAYYGKLGKNLQEKTQKRIHWICDQVSGDNVLDIGCSQGITSILLGKRDKNVLGVDISERAIEEAIEALNNESVNVQKNVAFACHDFLQYHFNNKQYDTILITEVLEHLPHPIEFIEKAAQLLHSNGQLIITVPFGISDHPDHKHTFYFLEIFQILHKYFNLDEISIIGKWIAFVGIKKESTTFEPETININYVKRLEQAFFDIERALVDERNLKHKNLKELYIQKKTFIETIENLQELNKGLSVQIQNKAHEEELIENLKEFNKDNVQLRKKDLLLIKKLKLELQEGCKGKIKTFLKKFAIIQKSLPIYKKYMKKEYEDVTTKRPNIIKIHNVIKKPDPVKELLDNGYRYVEDIHDYISDTTNLNIVYAIHNSLPETNNGYAIRSHYIAKSVQSQKINIYPVTRVGFPLDLKKIGEYKNDDFNPIVDSLPYYRMNKEGFGWGKTTIPKYLENYSRMLAQFASAREASIIHAASNYVNGLAAVNAAKMLNIPSIYEVRGFWEITGASRNPDFKNSALFKMQKRLEIQACTDATSVIALSEIVKEELMNRGIDEDKIYVVPNGVNTEKMKPLEKNIKLLEKFEWKEKFVVGFIGSVVDYEGLELLIESAKKLETNGYDNFRYMIVGDGNDLENLKKSVEEKKLSELFLFMGRVPYEDVEQYYSIMDAACYPRLNWEVCSIVSPKKPFEAMAYGVPIISSSVRANSYFIEDEVNGLVHESENSDSIVEKLKLLYEDDVLKQKIGSTGREWVVKNRESKVAGPKLEKIYRLTIDKFIQENTQ